MLHLLAVLRGFRIALVAVWCDPETKALPLAAGNILLGLGVMVALLSSLARHYIRHTVEVADRTRGHLSAITHHRQPPDEGGSQ